ncbi:MAG TPA: hypothetical protein VNH64_11710, partial [Parvularculaceae bacterium]|nr:hypothetical protein [Parvularculaceae bacterium]
TVCKAIAQAFRFASNAINEARTNLVARNREVLLAAGRDAAARMVEREFERFGDAVRRDLGHYPSLHQALSERARKLDEDYAASTATPPSPPGWAEAVEAVAAVPAKADPVLRQVLESIHGSFRKAANEANENYRQDFRGRHKLLNEMAPNWRESLKLLGEVKTRFDAVNARAASVDRHMAKYEEIASGADRAAAALQSSALVQFFIAGLVLLVATGGAVVNFHLIARPMSEMVGGNTFIGAFRTADIAALVIILVELSMGLFLMECLRITNLFPAVSALSDTVRRRLAFAAGTILFSLACVEAGLAYMRELLLTDELATSALLRGDSAAGAPNSFLWITTAAQMGMGFVLPFALTFVAIPLETFVHSLRAVLGWAAAGALLALSFALNLGARLFEEGSGVLAQLYDVVIFAPLWVDHRFFNVGEESAARTRRAKPVGAKAMIDDVQERLAG